MRTGIQTNAKVSTTRKIKKAKLTKTDTLDVTFEEYITIIEEKEGKEEITELSRNVTVEGKNIVHDDMKNAMRLLSTHLAFLCDQIEAYDKGFYELDDDPDALARYKVTSYTLGGSGDHEGVTLSGSRKGRAGALINLNSPFTKFVGGEHDEPYDYAFELSSLIAHCNEEANKYIDGKISPNVQLDIFDQEDIDDVGEDFE